VSLFERAYLLVFDDDKEREAAAAVALVGRLHARVVPALVIVDGRSAPCSSRCD
jgi:hypothetical protein